MKVCIDTLGAAGTSGGMKLYAEEIVRTWQTEFPHDRIVVIGPAWIAEDFTAGPRLRLIRWPNDNVASRIIGQVLISGLVFRLTRSDAIYSVSSVVSPLAPRSRRFCAIHDWRHMRRASEYGSVQRLYRRFWTWSMEHAAGVFAISAKTHDETKTYAPLARVHLVENGSDHARRWTTVSRVASNTQSVLTFGHYPNKRPELVIAAVNAIRTAAEPHVVVLGATGDYRDELASLTRDTGYGQRDTFPGFVPAEEYQRLLQSAGVVVLASTDEGFGLPVVEARYFGVPVVATTDSGLSSIHDDLTCVEPTVDALAEAISAALRDGPHAGRTDCGKTWAHTVRTIRGHISGTAGPQPEHAGPRERAS